MIVGYVLYLFVNNLYVVMPDNETMQYSTSVQVLAKYLYENSTVVRCSQFPKGAAKFWNVLFMLFLFCVKGQIQTSVDALMPHKAQSK